jgi:isoquinoline 1-oxidoreductase beta subunit
MTAGRLPEKQFSRKAFLQGGGALIVGFSLGRAALASGASAARPGTPLPISADQVDSYLTVHADNTATLYSSIMERGQGTRTSLLMIAAEELDIGMAQISHAPLDTSTHPSPVLQAAAREQRSAVRSCARPRPRRNRRCSASHRQRSAFRLRS